MEKSVGLGCAYKENCYPIREIDPGDAIFVRRHMLLTLNLEFFHRSFRRRTAIAKYCIVHIKSMSRVGICRDILYCTCTIHMLVLHIYL